MNSARLIALFSLVFFSIYESRGQARLVINNDAFIVIDNSAFVVLDNGASNAITTLGTGGRIVSENENDRIKWNIGTSTGTYTIPYSTAAGVEFPMSVTINVAGVGAGNITFSTYNGPTWDNNTYRPSDVTHMFDLATGTVNNSNHVIDRFWIVDALSYTTKPSSTLSFTYIDAEHLTPGNAIVEMNLGAQRFNNSSNIWGDYLPVGTINTATNVVNAIPATPANFFRSWTLSETTSPLPVELLGYELHCDNKEVNVNWTVASETGTAYYRIDGSFNGIDYDPLKLISPIGAVGTISYSEKVANQYYYFRLVSIDDQGNEKTEAVATADCLGESTVEVNYYNGQIHSSSFFAEEDQLYLQVYNATGQIVWSNSAFVEKEVQQYNSYSIDLSTGIYFINASSIDNKINKTFKLFIPKK